MNILFRFIPLLTFCVVIYSPLAHPVPTDPRTTLLSHNIEEQYPTTPSSPSLFLHVDSDSADYVDISESLFVLCVEETIKWRNNLHEEMMDIQKKLETGTVHEYSQQIMNILTKKFILEETFEIQLDPELQHTLTNEDCNIMLNNLMQTADDEITKQDAVLYMFQLFINETFDIKIFMDIDGNTFFDNTNSE